VFKFLVFLLIFSLSPVQSPAMECDSLRETLNSFHLETENEKYHFLEVEFSNLMREDYLNFIDLTNDFEAVQKMFGTVVACAFWCASQFNPAVAYEAMVEKRSDYRKNDPAYPVKDWFIEDCKNNKFVGHISLFGPHISPSEDILKKINTSLSDILEMGGAVVKEYRGKHIVSRLTPLFLKKLSNHRDYANKYIFLYTLTENSPVHKIALKNKFESYGTIEDPFDFVLFTMNLSVNVFARKV
jgi:RimJ/RimL family protein N-acetyltransferase